MRKVFEVFNFECMFCLVPGDYLSLDETSYPMPMRTQITFKQYNPSQPAKYGLLLKAINAARFHTHSLLLHIVVSWLGILENMMYLAHLK